LYIVSDCYRIHTAQSIHKNFVANKTFALVLVMGHYFLFIVALEVNMKIHQFARN